MDVKRLVEMLRASIEPTRHRQAEAELLQIHKIIGFGPALLKIVLFDEAILPVRQAASIYLKNFITKTWQDPGDSQTFSIHEQDRAMLRDGIIEAIVNGPELTRINLCISLQAILKHDFPGKWSKIVEKIVFYLRNPNCMCWLGALMCLYQLIKKYEYQIIRTPLIEAMRVLLPMLYRILMTIMPDQSDSGEMIKKYVLKNFYALLKNSLPLELFTRENFKEWMEALRGVLQQALPEHNMHVDEDDRPRLLCWKNKKWVLQTLSRLYERYGDLKKVTEDYKKFSLWYLNTFSRGVLKILMNILNENRRQLYISPRVLQQSFSYVDLSIRRNHNWDLIEPSMFVIIEQVIYPMVSFTDADEDLWNTDPVEYIRIRHDEFEDAVSMLNTAKTLLATCCDQHELMLHRTMQMCISVLREAETIQDPKRKEGALEIMSSLSNVLFNSLVYKHNMEMYVAEFVMPALIHPLGYIRARGFTVLFCFGAMHFENNDLLNAAVSLTLNALLNDTELPVMIEAALALQQLLHSQPPVQAVVAPLIKPVTIKLLEILRLTESDVCSTAFQNIFTMFRTELVPIASGICHHLATTFSQQIFDSSISDVKSMAGTELLATIETVLGASKNNPELMDHLEMIIQGLVTPIFTGNHTDFFEEALTLLCAITSRRVTPPMWEVFELLYRVYLSHGCDFFADMMPVLHNYVTNDRVGFNSNPDRMVAVVNMCKGVLDEQINEDLQVHAAQLMEVTILQCREKIDPCLPLITEVIVRRLTKNVRNSELRTIALEVLISILYSSPVTLWTCIVGLQETLPNILILEHFLQQWLLDTNNFIGFHSRKLCVLAMCKLLELGSERPTLPASFVQRLLPSCLVWLEGLAGGMTGPHGAIGQPATAGPAMPQHGVMQGYASPAHAWSDSGIVGYNFTFEDVDPDADVFVIFKEATEKVRIDEPDFYAALVNDLNDQQQNALMDMYSIAIMNYI